MAFRDKAKEIGSLMGIEEALARISMELLQPEENKLLTVSDVTPEEIFTIALLMSYGKEFNSKMINEWVKKFLLLRISRWRFGRKEFLLLGTGLREATEEKGKKASLKSLFAGMSGR